MIVWIAALRAEAQPLVQRLSLRAFARATPWPLYLAADGDAALVVSGVGKAASAAAVGWAQGVLDVAASGRSSRREAPGAVSPGAEGAGKTIHAWVNVGIAGHSSGPLGRVLLAHRVVDVATQRAWYPPPVPGVTLESDTVFTVDRPESAFEAAGAFDMEASGFLTAASRCGSAELAQVVKIVSDTPERPAAELGRREISSLVEARLDEIFTLGEALAARGSALAERDVEPAGFADFVARWRFSTTQRRQLRRLLQRRSALAPGASPLLPEARDGRAALAALARAVRLLAVEG